MDDIVDRNDPDYAILDADVYQNQQDNAKRFRDLITYITIDQPAYLQTLAQLDQLAQMPQKYTVQALNDAADGVKRRVVDRLVKEVNLPQEQIEKRVSTTYATQRDGYSMVSISSEAIPLIDYGAREDERGVIAQPTRGGATVHLAAAFISTMPNDPELNVWQRDKTSGRHRAGRLPISEAFGPSLKSIVNKTPNELQDLEREAMFELRDQMVQQVMAFDGVTRSDISYAYEEITGYLGY